jgi:hypothetical protein
VSRHQNHLNRVVAAICHQVGSTPVIGCPAASSVSTAFHALGRVVFLVDPQDAVHADDVLVAQDPRGLVQAARGRAHRERRPVAVQDRFANRAEVGRGRQLGVERRERRGDVAGIRRIGGQVVDLGKDARDLGIEEREDRVDAGLRWRASSPSH